MRARYAAFAQRQPDFLMRTTHPEGEEWNSDTKAWKKELLGFTDSFFFAGLKVGEVKTLGDDKASVKFTANLVRKEGVIPFDLEETSEDCARRRRQLALHARRRRDGRRAPSKGTRRSRTTQVARGAERRGVSVVWALRYV